VSPKVIRVVAMVVCLGVGIPGMIIATLDDNNVGAAVTFGIIAAVAALVLLAVTTATTPRLAPTQMTVGADPGTAVDEAEAEALEARVRALVDAGADEDQVRDVVRAAVRLGRGG
jgi:hypothetical protein